MTRSSCRRRTLAEVLLGNLLEDFPNGSARIGLGGDRTTDHQIVGAVLESFAWCRDSLLIIRCGPGRTNPGGDDHDAGSELFAQSFDFARARDQAANAGRGAELGESKRLLFHARLDAGFSQRYFIGAG